MKAETIQWSAVYPLFGGKDHLPLGGKPGVYRIRAFTAPGKPLSINRMGEVDPLGEEIGVGLEFCCLSEGPVAALAAAGKTGRWAAPPSAHFLL